MTRNAATRLQQQPHRVADRQQQQSSGSNEFQPQMPQFDGRNAAPQRQHAGHETSGDRRNNHGC